MSGRLQFQIVLGVLFVLMSGALARGQDAPVTSSSLIETPLQELSLELVPLRLAELEAMLDPMLGELERSAFGLVELIRVEQRAAEVQREPAMLARLQDQRLEAASRHAELVERVTVLLDSIEAKGGDVAEARLYVQQVGAIRAPGDANRQEPEAEATADERLALRLDAMVAEVQAMPPVHERAEPWTLSVAELTLELQPLQSEEIERRLGIWKTILQGEVRKRVRIDIALERMEAGDPEFIGQIPEDLRSRSIQQLADRSSEQQIVIEQLVERIGAMLKMLQDRGVDVAEHRKYVSAATGQRLNLWNPSVLWSQVRNWATSPTGGIKVLVNMAKFIGVLVVFYVLSRVLKRAASAAMGRVHKVSSLLRDFVVRSVSRVTLAVGLVAAISATGVEMGWALAMIGAAGLVIGLALQGTLSNFASGLLILFYKPFDVGNVVEAGGVNGKVEKLSLFTTTIMTFDNRVMHVPNNEIWGNVITNATGRKTRRVDLTFGVGYGDDLGKAQSLLETIVTGHSKVLKSPEPTIKVNELADSSVNFVVRPWVKTEDYWDVYWDLMRQVKERFDAEGLNIPFPQRDLHVPGPIEVKLMGSTGSA